MRRGLDRRERAVSAAAVAVVHVAVGYLLIAGAAPFVRIAPDNALKTFDVSEPPPPPIAAEPAPARAREREGVAAERNLKAAPSPIVAPPPVVLMPPPVIAAPIAGSGSEAKAGASPLPGPGTGAGGRGVGLGSGNAGDGTGGGGGWTSARLVRGSIVDRDYPPAARRAGAMGTVVTRFTVGADGRARGCGVARSSGNRDLDATTCRLIEARFRYTPARDARGNPVAEPRGWRQDWWFEP